ncbi:helix-turn-helix domain-containing protein [Mycobacteroides abscessus]|uniref:helix-turn-helix domain-containing protein n=1 Tax=Mycobacteroides abscessus TaxID=36809 RepID=UPI001A95ABBA|nr:helix-turn-helix domain-containing protein [Mycobacteroides abscessus]
MSAPVAVVLPAVVAPIVGSLAWMVATRKQLKMLDADSAPDPELPPESMAQSDTAIGSEVGPDRAVLVVAEQICDNIDALTAVYDDTSLVDVLDTAVELNEIAATTVKLAEIRLASDGEDTLFEQERIAALTAEREGLIQRVAALFTYGQQLAAAVRVCQEQQRASAQTDLLVLSEIAELPSRLPDRADFYARGVQHEEAATRITHAANQFGVSPRAGMDLGDQADPPYHASKTIVSQEFSAEAIEDRVAERAAGNAELEAQFIAPGVTPTSVLMVPMMPMMSAPQSPPEYASCHPCGAEPCDIPDLNPVTHRGENPYGYQTRVLIVPRDAHGFKGRYLDCPVEIPMAADKPVSEHIAALIPYLVVVSKAQGKDASWFEDESARWVLKKALVRQPLSDELSLAQQNIRDGSFLYLIKREVPKADIHTAGPVEGQIAEVVRNRRLQLGFSLKETADRADISASLLAGMECGRARLSTGARDRLEGVLGLPRGELGQSARGETTASSSTFGAWEQGF